MSKQNKKEKEKSTIYQPDDNFFKQVMRDRENAKSYLKSFYPELASSLDLRTLKLENESFTTPEFKTFSSDIIYSCQFKEGKKQVKLALLWEHKLQAEKHIAIQLGLYLFLAMHKMVKGKDKNLEPIIPLLFYNGKKKWEPKGVKQLFEKHPHFESFKKYLPDFDFLFKDISSSSEKELYSLENAFFRSSMIAMASRNNSDLIFRRISVIFDLVGSNFELTILSKYVLQFIDRSNEEVEKEVKSISSKDNKNKIMSILERTRKEGMEKGAKLNAVLGLMRIFSRFPSFSPKEIVEFTDMPLKIVRIAKSAIQNQDKKELFNTLNEKYLPKVALDDTGKSEIQALIDKLI